MKKIVVVGGGPAGMMAAISAKTHFTASDVHLMERNAELGKKLKLTGGGRCNVTANVTNEVVVAATPKNGKFLYSALSHFNPQDIQNFFTTNGCPLKIEDHGRVFPASNKSRDIITTLENKLQELDVHLHYHAHIIDINPDKKVLYFDGIPEGYSYDALILTTGGKTYPMTGSDGTGYALAQKFGHTITELLPAEVPLVSNDAVIADKTLQGLSFKDVTVTLLNQKQKKVASITHDLLFTHFGISGPAGLRMSFYVQKLLAKQKTVLLHIDFLPTISHEHVLDVIKNDTLTQLDLPKRLIQYLTTLAPNDINLLAKYIKSFPLNVYETRGFKQAFVTNGGITLKEVAPQTLKSKLAPELAFAGEILDTNAFTGGFNITGALATGYTAGKFILAE